MRALSIRQPYAELILRGIKTVEYRSRPTRVIGERFFIYAARSGGWKNPGRQKGQREQSQGAGIVADNIVVPDEPPPEWMIELANALRLFPRELPTGVIVGSTMISHCTGPHPRRSPLIAPPWACDPESRTPGLLYHWHLTKVERFSRRRKPKGHPQPVWFQPF